jgi:hypothetical protein
MVDGGKGNLPTVATIDQRGAEMALRNGGDGLHLRGRLRVRLDVTA